MKKKVLCLLSLVALLTGCNNSVSTPTNGVTTSSTPNLSCPENEVNVIVLAGQSNAEGNSNAVNLEGYCIDTGNSYEEYVNGYNDVKITYHNHYYYGTSYNYSNRDNPFEPNFVDVKVGQGKATGWAGPELGMAQYIPENIESDKPVYIIKFASGGTSFAGTPSWKSPSSGQNGELYTKLVKYVTNGLENLTEKGLSPKLRAFVWMQGESDGGNVNHANEYKNNMKNMVTDFRNNFSSYAADNNGDNIGVVDGYIADSGAWSQYYVINKAKQNLAKEMPNYYIVDTTKKGLNLQLNNLEHGGGDGFHYTIDSIIKLGQAFGKRIVDKNLLRYNAGTVEEEFKDFSTDDGITRNKKIVLEAEKGIFKHGSALKVESNGSSSGGQHIGYFWENGAPRIKYVIQADKAEEKALISVRMAPAYEQARKELDHPIYKTRMLSVNGEEVRLNGVMKPRVSWTDFNDYCGFVNLKQGINVIEFHHDLYQTYSMEEGRINLDCISVNTKEATLVNTNTAILEAENCTLDKASISSVVSNSPSNAGSIDKLNTVGASVSGKFTSTKAGLSSFIASIGLNTEVNLNEYVELEVNNQKVNLHDVKLPEYNLDIVAGSDWREFALADVNLIEGENTFKLSVIKNGLDVKIDYFRICSTSEIKVPEVAKKNEYKFECEDSSHFTFTGAAKIDTGNGASGNKYIGSMSVNVSSLTFKFNASADANVRIKICFGLALDFNMADCFNIYLTNSENNRKQVDDRFNTDIPGSSTNQWFNWTVITIGNLDVKKGENTLLFDHPDSSKYATNLDYFIIETDAVIS